MRPGLDITRIADSLLRSMAELRCVATMQDTGEFRVAGRLPGRSMLVCYEPPGVKGWDFEVTLEEGFGTDCITPRQLAARLFAGHSWCDVYAFGLAWLVPESEWPDGAREYKVTRRQIRQLLADGRVWPLPLTPGRPLPESLQGYYRIPAAGQGVITGPEQRVLEQLGMWVAMGWRIRGL